MYKIYGSHMCPDCIACKTNFDAYSIAYDFHDVTLSLHDLSDFLDLRDRDSVFDHCKEIKDIGLPALIKEDGSITLDWESIVRSSGHEVIEIQSGKACSIDRKGC